MNSFWMNVFVLFCIFHDYGRSTEECQCTDVCVEPKKEELGRSTWNLLHSIVDNVEYSKENEILFQNLILSLEELYPCSECREHIKEMKLYQQEIEMTPKWVCEFHNKVNHQLKKKEMDCSHLDKSFTPRPN